jgi:Anti-sigma factor NepR
MTDKQRSAKRASRKPMTQRNAVNGASDPVSGIVVRDAIGKSLQAHFDDIANTPVPDKFLVLLAELEAKEARGEN